MAKILLFGVKKEKYQAIRTVAQKVGADVITVDHKDYGQKIGTLAGITGFPRDRKTYEGPDFAAEMLVFSGLTPPQVDMFLDEYKATGQPPVPLKAIVTPHNVTWTADALFRELMKEHLYSYSL